jgi:hypothetical protein
LLQNLSLKVKKVSFKKGEKIKDFFRKKARNDFEKPGNILLPSPGPKAKYGKVHIF